MDKRRFWIYSICIGGIPLITRVILFFAFKVDKPLESMISVTDISIFGAILGFNNLHDLNNLPIDTYNTPREFRGFNVMKSALLVFASAGIFILGVLDSMSNGLFARGLIIALTFLLLIIGFGYSYSIYYTDPTRS